MNILQIGTIDKKGGAALVAYRLKERLEKRGHTTSLFVKEKYSSDKNVFSFRRWGRLGNKMEDILHFHLANDLEFYRSDYLLKTKEFRETDIVHCHNLHGGFFNLRLLAKISSIKPVVWTLHDMWAITGHCAHSFDCQKWQMGCRQCPYLKNPPGLKWDNTCYLWKKKKKIYQKAKLNLVVPSSWLKGKIKKSILKNQPLRLVYNGIDHQVFKPYPKAKARKKLGLPADKKLILFVFPGERADIYKGWRYAEKVIDYFKRNKNIFFLCLGGGRKTKKHLRGGSDVTSDTLRMVEGTDDEALLAQYYSASDLFLLPSVAENFPLVVLEAMSCGLPIVSFAVGGVGEAVLHKQNGYLAKYENLDDLIKGIEFILGLADDKVRKMSRSSIQRVKEKFSLDLMVDNYLELYAHHLYYP